MDMLTSDRINSVLMCQLGRVEKKKKSICIIFINRAILFSTITFLAFAKESGLI